MQAKFAVIGFDSNGESNELATFSTESAARDWVRSYTRWGDWGGYDVFACHAIPFHGDWLWIIDRENS